MSPQLWDAPPSLFDSCFAHWSSSSVTLVCAWNDVEEGSQSSAERENRCIDTWLSGTLKTAPLHVQASRDQLRCPANEQILIQIRANRIGFQSLALGSALEPIGCERLCLARKIGLSTPTLSVQFRTDIGMTASQAPIDFSEGELLFPASINQPPFLVIEIPVALSHTLPPVELGYRGALWC